jgi:hypothetical protein
LVTLPDDKTKAKWVLNKELGEEKKTDLVLLMWEGYGSHPTTLI